MTNVRTATPDDAEAIHAIYAPLVAQTPLTFEIEPPTVAEIRSRIAATLQRHPWLVSLDDAGRVDGYSYAGKLRERAAYRWAVETAVYVRADSRGRGVGRRLYGVLFNELVELGYFQAFVGIALPNAASVALHESLGFQLLGVYRNVGYKLGAWHDVGRWQRALRPLEEAPAEPRPFSAEAFALRTR